MQMRYVVMHLPERSEKAARVATYISADSLHSTPR